MLIPAAILILLVSAVAVVVGQAPAATTTPGDTTVQVMGCNGRFVAVVPKFLIDQNPDLEGKPICFVTVMGSNGDLMPAVNTLAPGSSPRPASPSPSPATIIRVYPVQNPSPLMSPSPEPPYRLPPSPSPMVIPISPGPGQTVRVAGPTSGPATLSAPSSPSPSPSPAAPATIQPPSIPASFTSPSPGISPQSILATVAPQIADRIHLVFQNVSNLQFDSSTPLPVPTPVSGRPTPSAPSPPSGPSTLEPDIVIEEPLKLPLSPVAPSPSPTTPSTTPVPAIPITPIVLTQLPSTSAPISARSSSPSEGNGNMNQTFSESTVETNATTMAVLNSNRILPIRGYDDNDNDNEDEDEDDGDGREGDDDRGRSAMNQTAATSEKRSNLVSIPFSPRSTNEMNVQPGSDRQQQRRPVDAAAPVGMSTRPAPNQHQQQPSTKDQIPPTTFDTPSSPPHQPLPSSSQERPDSYPISYWKIVSVSAALAAVIAIPILIMKRLQQKAKTLYELPTAADRNRQGQSVIKADLKAPSRSILTCGGSLA